MDHALARALGYHSSNKPLFGFAKRYQETDPRIRRELNMALAQQSSTGNEKGALLCLWAGGDPHATVPALPYFEELRTRMTTRMSIQRSPPRAGSATQCSSSGLLLIRRGTTSRHSS
jgi:hypothetical protein